VQPERNRQPWAAAITHTLTGRTSGPGHPAIQPCCGRGLQRQRTGTASRKRSATPRQRPWLPRLHLAPPADRAAGSMRSEGKD